MSAWKTCPYSSSQRLRFQQGNPKKLLSAAYERYERYRAAETIGEFLAAFNKVPADCKFAKVDFENDLAKGYVQLEHNVPAPADESAASVPEARLETAAEPAGSVPEPAAQVVEPEALAAPAEKEQVQEVQEAPKEAQEPADKPDEHIGRAKLLEATGASHTESTAGVGGKRASRLHASTPKSDDRSLFSLLDDQPKTLEKAKGAKDGKAKKEKKVKDAKPAASKKKEKREAPVKVLQAREFVRDVVTDYIEGQPDPPPRPLPETQQKVATDSPMANANRNGFIWVADSGQGYTHDFKAAKPMSVAKRCDVCGRDCGRFFRIRCYARRPKDAASELKAPRLMSRETFYAGTGIGPSLGPVIFH